ncbi:MAG: hypothetical protein HRU20_15080 [Pseudomonadales bacterium]|nr:hypothetical protein [Pseudomonadales bacterium]
MKSQKNYYSALAVLASSIFFAACEESIDVPTGEMFADFSVISYGTGESYVNAGLEKEALFSAVNLSEGERFVSEFNGEQIVMEKIDASELPFPLNILIDVMEDIMPYVSQYPSENSGDEFTIILERKDGTVYTSTASLPEAPEITFPESMAEFEATDDIIIQWQTVNSDVVMLDHISFCYDIDSAGGDPMKILALTEKYPDSTSDSESVMVLDNGSYSISAETLLGNAVPAPGLTRCKVRVEITHTQTGVVDENFHARSVFEARQIRELDFYIKL